MDRYKCIYEGGQGEIEEKKSRFIATVKSVTSEEEATAFINEMKKKYWDARHNCSAFVIGRDASLTRCSDDGEPSGTAGRPMLEVLLGSKICNVAVVVTRYFGGVLLGTGGLVRAYSEAVKEGLKESTIIEMIDGVRAEVISDYNLSGKLQYIFASEECIIENTEYGSDVKFILLIPASEQNSLAKKITEATSAQCSLKVTETCSYGKAGDTLVVKDVKQVDQA